MRTTADECRSAGRSANPFRSSGLLAGHPFVRAWSVSVVSSTVSIVVAVVVSWRRTWSVEDRYVGRRRER
ncbi:hypothetical protein BRC68_12220 [Halobacteriales archaeon QH_6_64_20]|nr:MAG: hypothetical protein BRC68_12220 [Halobacteriales archaeon QH_6_64_20]